MATKKKEITNALAVIELAGKQYLVKEGDKVECEKLEAKEGDVITVKEVLLFHDGVETKVGTPYVEGASVSLKFNEEVKGEKVEIRKYKAKSRYRRTTGHRQTLAHLTVTGVSLK